MALPILLNIQIQLLLTDRTTSLRKYKRHYIYKMASNLKHLSYDMWSLLWNRMWNLHRSTIKQKIEGEKVSPDTISPVPLLCSKCTILFSCVGESLKHAGPEVVVSPVTGHTRLSLLSPQWPQLLPCLTASARFDLLPVHRPSSFTLQDFFSKCFFSELPLILSLRGKTLH